MPIVIKKKPQPVNPFPDIPDPFGYGQRAVDFLRSLKHPKSTLPGKRFQLDPWLEEIVRRTYGPRYTEDVFTDDGILLHAKGDRIVSDVVILVPRGNRKTGFCGALSLLHTMGPEAIPHSEVICAAVDRDQALKIFTEAKNIIIAGDGNLWRKGQGNLRYDAASQIKLQEYKSRLTFPNGSYLYAMGADAEAEHGGTPVAAFIDEIHAHKNRKLWDVIDSSLAKTNHTLRVTITTAGRGQDSIGHEVIENARKVARGEIDDPHTLAVLYETPPDADWRDEKVWLKANPGLRYGYPSYGYLRQKAKKAENSPGNLDTFKMLHLNMWLEKTTSPFIELDIYDKGSAPIDVDALKGEPCWLGVDLGLSDDLSAVVAAFRDRNQEEGYIVLPFFFMPADNLDKKQIQSGFPYVHHVDAGRIIITPGNVTDYGVIEDKIRNLCATYQVREIAIDPHLATQMMQNLMRDDLPVVQFFQKGSYMKAGIKELERAILAGRFQHGGHPVLRWNFSNVEVVTDDSGSQLFKKGGTKPHKIDGAVAAAMAVARAATGEGSTTSIFDDPNVSAADLVW